MMKIAMSKNYSELITLPTFKERFDYLSIGGTVGEDTFGFDRYLNQSFYHSNEWRKFRREIVIRDEGLDLGLDGYPIKGQILIHHINPIDASDIVDFTRALLDPENVISCSKLTHNAIHYGSFELLPKDLIERTRNDTCPWRV